MLYASPRPKYGVYSPILTPGGWLLSAGTPRPHTRFELQGRFPGDYNYREFYRDNSYDLELDYIGEFLHHGGMGAIRA